MMERVLHRVSSPTFVGRTCELAALDGALARAAGGVPAFVGGRVEAAAVAHSLGLTGG